MHRHRQLHLWITDHDYAALRDIADEKRETLSAVIRRLIKLHRPTPTFRGPIEEPDSTMFHLPPF
jgi:hypothetical protein